MEKELVTEWKKRKFIKLKNIRETAQRQKIHWVRNTALRSVITQRDFGGNRYERDDIFSCVASLRVERGNVRASRGRESSPAIVNHVALRQSEEFKATFTNETSTHDP